MIILHQWRHSPFCGKVRAVLRCKGLDFRVKEYLGWQVPKAFRVGPTGKLPVMEYDGRRLEDSTRIALFLEERHPSPALVPSNARDQSLVHLLEDWADESLFWFMAYFRATEPAALRQIVTGISGKESGWQNWVIEKNLRTKYATKLRAQGLGRVPAEQVRRQFLDHVDHIASLLDGRDWLVGASQTLADIAVAAQLEVIARHHEIRHAIYARGPVKRWLGRVADTSER
jgi:glutathione S-transferase